MLLLYIQRKIQKLLIYLKLVETDGGVVIYIKTGMESETAGNKFYCCNNLISMKKL